jgi:hypothetical protein
MECEQRHVKRRGGLLNPFYSLPVPILTRDGEVVALLAGRPQDQSYEETLNELEGRVTDAGNAFQFNARQRDNRRGDYLAISTGISFGGGSMVRDFEQT